PSARAGSPSPQPVEGPRHRAGPERWRRGRNRWDRSQPDNQAVAPLARSPARAAPPSGSPFDARGYAPRPTRLASEQHFESVALEARLPHREALEGLGQDQIALVRTDLDVQLVPPAVDVEVLAAGEGKPHREHVARAALADADRLVHVQDVGDVGL